MASNLLLKPTVKLKDARTIPPEQLYERRKQAIALFEKGMTRQEIAPLVGVGRNAVGEWIRLWQDGGVSALKVGSSGKPKGSGSTLNNYQQSRISKMLVERVPDQLKMPFALWNREAVKQLIKDQFGIEMPIRTVGHYLKKWGFTPQKPVKRAYERNDKKVNQWIETDYPLLAKRAKAEGGEIHWGDETGVCSEDQVGRGYSPKGQTPVRLHRGAKERINMISTVTNQGKVRFMFYEGSMNSDCLIKFMRRLIKDAKRKVFLILDNLPTHHSKKVREWVGKRPQKIELHFLPSYSPDLNPDEYLNGDLKGELSRKPSRREKGEFKTQAKSSMRSLAKKSKRIQSYFNATPLKYISDAA